jgi:alpha-1,3-mannosyltransferase
MAAGAAKQMIRICHVVRQYQPSVGGLESFVASLAREQIRLGAACDVVTLDRVFQGDGARLPASETVDGVNVRRVPMFGARRYFAPLAKSSLFDGYDVLHAHAIDGFFERIARLPRRAETVRVLTTHGGIFHTRWLAPLKRVYFDTIARAAGRQYDLILANSDNDAALVRNWGPRVELVPNGVEPIGDFTAEGTDLLFIGRLTRHKRIDRLLAALAAPALARARLHLVGPPWDVTADELTALMAQHGAADRVIVHGYAGADRLAEIARACGVFVSASEYEGFGMSMIEAMSVGLIPVVQPNLSFRTLVKNAGVGAIIDYSDPMAAAESIRLAQTASPALRAKARTEASRYSWRGHAQRTLGLYAEQLESRVSGQAPYRPRWA